jgi:hypothetical protein
MDHSRPSPFGEHADVIVLSRSELVALPPTAALLFEYSVEREKEAWKAEIHRLVPQGELVVCSPHVYSFHCHVSRKRIYAARLRQRHPKSQQTSLQHCCSLLAF